MSYLLDTNILSETVKRRPDPVLVGWLEEVPDEALHVSVLTLGEIRRGVERLRDAARRERLRNWLEHELREWFGERVLGVGLEVADRWGRLLADLGRPAPTIDTLLGATALHHGLRLVTRNDRDFAFPGLEVINPWRLARS